MPNQTIQTLARVISSEIGADYTLTASYLILDSYNAETFAIPYRVLETAYNKLDDIEYDLKTYLKEQTLEEILEIDFSDFAINF